MKSSSLSPSSLRPRVATTTTATAPLSVMVALLWLSLIVVVVPVSAQGVVFITEINHNPLAVSDDNGEWFEVYNPSPNVSVNLQNWSVIGNTAGETFNITTPLTIAPLSYAVFGVNGNASINGNVTVNFVYKGGFGGFQLTNADRDKIILRNDLGVEIDRVEYSGTVEVGSFPNIEGSSMALRNTSLDNNNGTNWCRSGSKYNAVDQGSPGSETVCVVILPPAPPPPLALVIITEINHNPINVSDENGEWFEVYNPSSNTSVNLQNWSVTGSTATETFNITSPLTIAPLSYAVLGVNGNLTLNGNVTVNFVYKGGFGGFQLNNADRDCIILRNAAGVEIDRVEYSGTGSETGSFPNFEGSSMALRNVTLDNNNGTNWCRSGSKYNAVDQGSPGADTACAGVAPPPTPPPPPPPQIIITEIMNNPVNVSDDLGEWFEVYNIGTLNVSVNLQNWSVVGTTAAETFNITTPLVVAPRSYAVLGVNGNTSVNGNVTVNFVYKGGFGAFQLANADRDTIILRNALGVEQDRVEYSGTIGAERGSFPNVEGSSMALRNTSTSLLENNNVGTNWCRSGTRYNGVDQGSPGAGTVCGPDPPPIAPTPPNATPPSAPTASNATAPTAPVAPVAIAPAPPAAANATTSAAPIAVVAPMSPTVATPAAPTAPMAPPAAAAPAAAPVAAPTSRRRCGLLGLSLFCPMTQCGVLGRILGLCN